MKMSLQPTAEQLIEVVQDNITVRKAADIAKRGYLFTGFVLMHPVAGERAIVDCGTVRWLNNGEIWNLMHPKQEMPKWRL